MKYSKKFKLFLLSLVLIYIIFISIAQIKQIWLSIFRPNYDFYQSDDNHDYLTNETEKNKKFLLYECSKFCGGWADRLKGITSAYAWSLLTNRKFRIFITHPCRLDNLLIPNKIKWNSKLIVNGNDLQLLNNFTYAYIGYLDDKKFQSKLIDLDLINFKSNYDLLIIKNNQDWLNSLSKNHYLTRRINELGFNSENFNLFYLFKDWYKDLFNLSTYLDDKYKHVLDQINNTKIICAQIRIGGSRPNVKFDYQFNDRKVTKLFWHFIKEKFINDLLSRNENYKLFITTDHESVYEEAKTEFGNDKMIFIPGQYTHIDREYGLKNNCDRVDKTILDFHFMENCDYAVISESGYGKLSVLRRPKPFENLYLFNLHKKFVQANEKNLLFY